MAAPSKALDNALVQSFTTNLTKRNVKEKNPFLVFYPYLYNSSWNILWIQAYSFSNSLVMKINKDLKYENIY
jgi:hypothetical protein